jgi:hypothetical protein
MPWRLTKEYHCVLNPTVFCFSFMEQKKPRHIDTNQCNLNDFLIIVAKLRFVIVIVLLLLLLLQGVTSWGSSDFSKMFPVKLF